MLIEKDRLCKDYCIMQIRTNVNITLRHKNIQGITPGLKYSKSSNMSTGKQKSQHFIED
ncbi:hypothetical protein I2700191B6_04440 [Dorea formicigenerans]